MIEVNASKASALSRWPAPAAACVAGWLGFLLYVGIVIADCPPPFLGHDTEHFQHWASAAFEYGSSAIDQSVMSPYQGLGGLVQPLSVVAHPAYTVPT